MVRRSDNDYHLRVVSYCGDPESHRFERKVDDFLEDLYNVEATDHPTNQPPLAFSECKLSQHDGRQVVLVRPSIRVASRIFSTRSQIRFQLSASGAHRFTLDSALSDFCEKIFKPEAFSVARFLSWRSVLGLSAISGTFQRMWNNSLFRQVLSEREAFLRRIEDSFNDVYLPDWALASGYATFTGAIFLGSLTARDSGLELGQITMASICGCITIATSILIKLSTRVGPANPDLQQERWETSHKEFKQHMEKVMDTITILTVFQDDNRIEEHHANMCDYLYGAMAAAARTHIANRELFLAYVELHKEAQASMIAKGVMSGAYLATVTSAFSVMTTTAILPLSQWGLTEVMGLLLLGETPVVQTTMLTFCPPLAAISLGGAAYFGWSRYQDKKKKELFAKKLDYHRKLKVFIVKAWKVAHLTHTLLRLVYCITADRTTVEFVNDEARSEWRNFITRFNEAEGRIPPSAQLEPSYIRIFLNEQRRDFVAWHRDLAAHETQIV